MSDAKHAIQPHAAHGQVPARMHPIVEQAIAHNPDPATLRELLAVQREWESGEARKAYARALVALKRDLPQVIGHDKTVDFTSKTGVRTRYTHASLAAAMEAVTPHLTAHGFTLNWEPGRSERGDVVVTCRLLHSEGHSESCTLVAPVDTSGSKSPAQGVMSTITLLRRYTALSLLGIATADMTEPEGREPDGPHIDAARNLKAVGALKKYDRTREEAEAFLGKPVQQWTNEDLDKLREWVDQPQRQPGED